MSILKGILLVLVAIIAIVLIAGLFINKSYTVYREITINKPKQEVFDYIKYLKNQDYYSKWVMMDPNLKKSFSGTDGSVGFVYAWEGNKEAGKGEQELKEIQNGEKTVVEVRFEKPMEGIANTTMTTTAIGNNQTKVSWGMAGKNGYPMNVMNIFIDGILGKDLDTSLTNLKNVLEQK